jgi:hypothetical protein
MGVHLGRRKKQVEKILNPFSHEGRIAKTHASDGRPIEMVPGDNKPRATLVDLPNQKGMGPMQYNMPEGTGKRHLAKALKKPLIRRKL